MITKTFIKSVEIILMSIGAIFIVILISISFHQLIKYSTTNPTHLFSFFKAWLQPPCIYLIINAIIITLAFSSRSPHHHDVIMPYDAVLLHGVDQVEEKEVKMVEQVESEVVGQTVEVVESATWISPRPLVRQKPLDALLEEFLLQGKPAKANPGEKLLQLSKPKGHETLESTWKVITERKKISKKSDTSENQCHQINLLDEMSLTPISMKKFEMFKDRTNYLSPIVPSSRLKKESSLSQDELNQRVESFINKFNEDMKLQRQQSMQQFMQKINRAT